jgi:hypothetical protein
MRLYIAGKVTGDEDYKQKFDVIEAFLADAGYDVCNPIDYVLEGASWNEAMRAVIPEMLECDGVALLHDWQESTGAKLEVYIARQLDIPCKDVGEWLVYSKEREAEMF